MFVNEEKETSICWGWKTGEEWWRMRSERKTGFRFYRVKHFDFILRAMESRGKILGREIR